jgi:hypothetical protein
VVVAVLISKTITPLNLGIITIKHPKGVMVGVLLSHRTILKIIRFILNHSARNKAKVVVAINLAHTKVNNKVAGINLAHTKVNSKVAGINLVPLTKVSNNKAEATNLAHTKVNNNKAEATNLAHTKVNSNKAAAINHVPLTKVNSNKADTNLARLIKVNNKAVMVAVVLPIKVVAVGISHVLTKVVAVVTSNNARKAHLFPRRSWRKLKNATK